MGYYTNYEIVSGSEGARDFLREVSGYSWYDDHLQNAKWYGWLEDLESTSIKFPDELIVLGGVGEEYPDVWRAYAKGGVVKTVQAELTFKGPDFE